MIGAPIEVAAGQVRALVTNGGNHTPESWAAVTCDQLFECDAEISDKRRMFATALRDQTRAVLREVFSAVRADASEAVLWRDAVAAQGVITRYAAGTPWQQHFGHDGIAAIMRDVIYQNLRTAADLAVRWE
jgi:hypothetical protein